MARRNYVNPSDRGFEAQVAQFLANLGPVKTALGLPANWEAQLQTRKNSFTTALNSLDLAKANYRQAKQTKDAARRNLESEFRNLVRQLRANPNFTNAMAASLGLPPRDREPTPIQPGPEIPTLEVEIQSLRHTVRFWQADARGGCRGKPAWARAIRLVYAVVEPNEPPPPIERTSGIAGRGRRRAGRVGRGQTPHGPRWQDRTAVEPSSGHAAPFWETPSLRFPLQAGGTKSRFPSRRGGNLQEGGQNPPHTRLARKTVGLSGSKGRGHLRTLDTGLV
jgi:hypothetical protein